LPPELARGEAHAVAMLRLLVARHRVRVGEDEDAVIAVDDAALAARVTRQARVAEGVIVAREDALAGPEPRRHIVVHSREAAHARLPLGMEHRLVLLDFDRSHAVHAAHVVDAVHRLPRAGSFTCATPIIASRVTIAASSSSLQPSVPAGRSGSTR